MNGTMIEKRNSCKQFDQDKHPKGAPRLEKLKRKEFYGFININKYLTSKVVLNVFIIWTKHNTVRRKIEKN